MIYLNIWNVLPVDWETKSVTDDEIESSGIGHVHWESGNGIEGVVVIVDGDDKNEVQLDEESPDGVVCNLEGEEDEASVLIVDGETYPLVSAEIESNGRCDVIHEKSNSGGLKKLKLVEKVAVIAKSSNFSKTVSGEVAKSSNS